MIESKLPDDASLIAYLEGMMILNNFDAASQMHMLESEIIHEVLTAIPELDGKIKFSSDVQGADTEGHFKLVIDSQGMAVYHANKLLFDRAVSSAMARVFHGNN